MVNKIAALLIAAEHFSDKAFMLKGVKGKETAALHAHNRALDLYEEARDMIHEKGANFIKRYEK